MRFIHAADIHLDSPLRGLERYEGAPIEEIRGATRRALENLVQLCLTEDVAFLLIAGDLYDGDWRDYNTALFFANQATRLAREGIRVVWIRGNHDAASQITKRLRLPEGVFELGTERPETQVFEDLGVAIHGQSYRTRAVVDDLAAGYPDPAQGLLNVGLLHTALEGREGHDPYAPCTVERLISRGYAYWALGHVHRREVVCTEPWIVFPGNLQGRHAGEIGPKGASIVSVDDGIIAGVEHRELDAVRWVVCDVDATDAASGADVVDLVRAALESEVSAIGDRTLAARVRVSGVSRAHGALLRERERWIQEIRATALSLASPVWLERVLLATRTRENVDDPCRHGGPISHLIASLRSLSKGDPALAGLTTEFSALASRLPAEYRGSPGSLNLEHPGTLAALLPEVEQDLITRLLESQEDL